MIPQLKTNATVKHDDKETAIKELLTEISFVIDRYGKTQDPAVQRAIKELQSIQTHLEQGNDRRACNWAAVGKNLLFAAQWMKFIIDFLQQ